MKDLIEKHAPEPYKETILALYNQLPAIPQLPESDQINSSASKAKNDEETKESATSVTFSDQQRGQQPHRLAHMILVSVCLLSLLSQYGDVFDALAFRSNAILGQDGEVFPQVWTLITCNLFEQNFFFLGLHLLILNYFVGSLEHIWSRTAFAFLMIFTAVMTNVIRLAGQVSLAAIIESRRTDPDQSILAQPYCSINHMVLIVLMGCRQSYPERMLDTGIPFITSNVIVPFKQVPVAYMLLCWLAAFIFEMSIDFSLVLCLYFSWLFIRFFMVTKNSAPTLVGDTSEAFALSTFFPERLQPHIATFSSYCYKVANLCKLIDGTQACIKSRRVANAKSKAENRKKALTMLEEEISKKEDAPDLEAPEGKATETDKEPSEFIQDGADEWEDAIKKDQEAKEKARREQLKDVDMVTKRTSEKKTEEKQQDEEDDQFDEVEIQFEKDGVTGEDEDQK